MRPVAVNAAPMAMAIGLGNFTSAVPNPSNVVAYPAFVVTSSHLSKKLLGFRARVEPVELIYFALGYVPPHNVNLEVIDGNPNLLSATIAVATGYTCSMVAFLLDVKTSSNIALMS